MVAAVSDTNSRFGIGVRRSGAFGTVVWSGVLVGVEMAAFVQGGFVLADVSAQGRALEV